MSTLSKRIAAQSAALYESVSLLLETVKEGLCNVKYQIIVLFCFLSRL